MTQTTKVIINTTIVNQLDPKDPRYNISTFYTPQVKIRENIDRARTFPIPNSAKQGQHFQTYALIHNTDVMEGDLIEVRMEKGNPPETEDENSIIKGTGVVKYTSISEYPDIHKNLVEIKI